eukprot:5923671-Prymnesium_polylepis.1
MASSITQDPYSVARSRKSIHFTDSKIATPPCPTELRPPKPVLCTPATIAAAAASISADAVPVVDLALRPAAREELEVQVQKLLLRRAGR